ncbi:MAG: hypothetical protein ABSA40_04355 [Candidatus Dormibacteria bacterium]|jgi:hypothetical protein
MLSRLIGKWYGVEAGNPVEMEFGANGHVTYDVLVGERHHIMLLTWRVEGDVLISDQPSHPQEVRTQFRFEADGALILANEGVETRYFQEGTPPGSN